MLTRDADGYEDSDPVLADRTWCSVHRLAKVPVEQLDSRRPLGLPDPAGGPTVCVRCWFDAEDAALRPPPVEPPGDTACVICGAETAGWGVCPRCEYDRDDMRFDERSPQ